MVVSTFLREAPFWVAVQSERVVSGGAGSPSAAPGPLTGPLALSSQAEGYVIGSCIKHIPIAGRDITYFIQQLLRDREVGVPPEQSLETAKAVKVKPDGNGAALGVGRRETRRLDTSLRCHYSRPPPSPCECGSLPAPHLSKGLTDSPSSDPDLQSCVLRTGRSMRLERNWRERSVH